jgi:hypothetical protein
VDLVLFDGQWGIFTLSDPFKFEWE